MRVLIAEAGETAGNIAVAGEGGREGVNPLPNYLGSKGALNTVRRCVRLFTPHRLYIEAFLGSGAVARFKTPALQTIGIDEDPEVIAAWRRSPWPGLQLIEANAIAWLSEARGWLPEDALVFADPPYLITTRTSDKRYRHELTEAEHVQLLDVLDSLPCAVVLTGYDSELYNQRLRKWGRDSWPAMTRGGLRTEVAWFNRAIDDPALGVQPDCLGHDFRDRERMKRKVRRWGAKFDAMPERDRVAILTSLLAKYGELRGVGPTAGPGEDGHPFDVATSSTPMLWDPADLLAENGDAVANRDAQARAH